MEAAVHVCAVLGDVETLEFHFAAHAQADDLVGELEGKQTGDEGPRADADGAEQLDEKQMDAAVGSGLIKYKR